ncbi:LATE EMBRYOGENESIS ABUNDANT (LEA) HYDROXYPROLINE-RICH GLYCOPROTEIN FAMILY PROTEIN [Salix koriyanagi]|uniref:LATE EMBRYOGENESIS ABUNDANT (LEA) HYDROXYPROLINE-RICH GLYCOPROTEIN FAMILY PROTEIN n=1 Tax=Salix koriyanagi TaxID=2511006 RepID=A0A9Q0UCP8_9ROSI|nr:LATE EMBRYOGENESIS ABUNDANT (LEA) HYDROXYPROLINE-RICH GLYCOPROTEIN FAMILY PROTEIN [Salix koriyanagi]
MLSLPPPPPSPLPTEAAPPPEKRSFPVSLNQIVISKQARNPQNSSAETSNSESKKLSKPPIFKHPRPRRTNLVIWCGAILCLIFSLVLIVFGIATLIIYLVVKPRNPVFDIPNANLNSIYFDSPELVGTQALQPFTQRSRETRLESVHIISSLVYLPQNLAVELQKQVQSNKVNYNIRGTFKVRANMGLLHYSYWLHGRCEIEMTGPPTGVIVARSCRTKR